MSWDTCTHATPHPLDREDFIAEEQVFHVWGAAVPGDWDTQLLQRMQLDPARYELVADPLWLGWWVRRKGTLHTVAVSW